MCLGFGKSAGIQFDFNFVELFASLSEWNDSKVIFTR